MELNDELAMYLEDANGHLNELHNALTVLADCKTGDRDFSEASRLLHAVEGASVLVGLESIHSVTLELDKQLKSASSASGSTGDLYLQQFSRGVEFLDQCHQELSTGAELGTAPEVAQRLTEYLQTK